MCNQLIHICTECKVEHVRFEGDVCDSCFQRIMLEDEVLYGCDADVEYIKDNLGEHDG